MKGTEGVAKAGKKLLEILEKYKFVLLVLLAGVLLLLIPSAGADGGKEGTGGTSPPVELAFDLEGLERKLEETLSQIEGAGSVSVVLTVKASTRQILAQDVTSSQKEGEREEGATTVVVSKGSGRQETVPLQQIYPQFQGALVVCSGGDDPEIQLKLVGAVSALTGLGSDKISICKGK